VECEDYMTATLLPYFDNMYILAVVVLQLLIAKEYHNHGFMYPPKT